VLQPLQIKLEILKQYWETRQAVVSHLASLAVLLGLFVLLRGTRPFQYAASSPLGSSATWIYCAWVFCTGVSMDVAKSVNQDIMTGTLAKVAQAPLGLLGIVDSRYVANLLFSVVTTCIVGLLLLAAGNAFSQLDAVRILVMALMIPQAYSLALLMVAAALSQKSVAGAHMVGLVICLPVVVIPTEKLIGDWSALLLIGGPLAKLREPASWTDLLLLVAATVAWIAASRAVFRRVEQRLRFRGTLLYR
jgi:hypothetical protein